MVDHEVRSLESLRRSLDEDFEVFTAESAEAAAAILEREWVQVILCDQRMPGVSGVDFLKRVRGEWPECVRIIISGYTDSEDIIAGINDAGIYQYILKPWQSEQLLLTLQAAVELQRLHSENQRQSLELREATAGLRSRVADKRREPGRRQRADAQVRAPDSPVNALCELVEKAARHGIPVLLTGESGTGKELLARALHRCSPRRDDPFVVENCGALPDQLLESELFGHKRGAYTGAVDDRAGLFKQADRGTIFLDEIGETSPAFQIKLLRVLQEGEVRPLGAPRPVATDVRTVSATTAISMPRSRPAVFARTCSTASPRSPLRVPHCAIDPWTSRRSPRPAWTRSGGRWRPVSSRSAGNCCRA